jgi:hypothetical protein
MVRLPALTAQRDTRGLFLRQPGQRRGKEFAMQQPRSEIELEQAIRKLYAALPPEQRREGPSLEQCLEGPQRPRALRDLLGSMPPEQRISGSSPQELLAGLERSQALRELLASMPLDLRLAIWSADERRRKEQALEDRSKGPQATRASRDLEAAIPLEERFEEFPFGGCRGRPLEGRSNEPTTANIVRDMTPEGLEYLKDLLRQMRTAADTSRPGSS